MRSSAPTEEIEALATETATHVAANKRGDWKPSPLTMPLLASTGMLAGCGGGDQQMSTSIGGIFSPTPSPSPTPTPAPVAGSGITEEDAATARFLLRANFAVSRSLIEVVKSEGRQAWLARQMATPNDRTAAEFFAENGLDATDGSVEFKFDRLTDRMIWDQLLRGGNGVRKRIALALSEFFVVSANRLDVVWPAHAMGAYWDILNRNAFGNFRRLLEDVTLSPAMAAFLDTLGNRKEDPQSGRVPDENYAREIMQLFTIGLFELNIDGSLRTRNGQPIETYSNSDVEGLARVFTGYDLDASGLATFPSPLNGRPVFEPEIIRRKITPIPQNWPVPASESEHSMEPKAFLGTNIPAGTGPVESLKVALDVLFKHPNVGPFFAKQMIQRLVTSNPSPQYVERVARTFNDNGSGVRGDLSAVFSAILLDEEAGSVTTLNDFRFGKLRSPAERFIQLCRTFGFAVDDGLGITRNLSDSAKLLGHVPLRAPSVFNFFRPQYIKPQSVMQANDMAGPEFQLVNETSVAGYINFIDTTIRGRGFWLNDLRPDFGELLDLAAKPRALAEEVSLIVAAGQLQAFTIDKIVEALESLNVTEQSSSEERLAAVQLAVLLSMVSNDYLIQK